MTTPAKVLIVEDEKQIRRFVRVAVEAEGCQVAEAETMAQGLIEAGARQPDLLILDLGLPDGNGIDLIRDLRGWSDIPILILSARSQEHDKIDALDAGADDYLTKPFETEELLARLRALTRRKGEVQPDCFSIGDLTLNTRTSELSCGDKTIPLSLKEFQMMEILFRNADRIITKELLIDKVWGFDSEAVHNNVEVYVSFLRKKMKHLGSHVEIQTSRGIGYRIKQ